VEARTRSRRNAAIEAPENREELVNRNVRLAYYLAHRYKGIISEEDAISIALEALWNAALHYNPERRTPFSTYAGIAIANALRSAIRRTKRLEFLSLNELVDPEEFVNGEERIGFVVDPATEDWEMQAILRVDFARIMRHAPYDAAALIFWRDVCGYSFDEAARLEGLEGLSMERAKLNRKAFLQRMQEQYVY